jgi:hypothetical protein
MQSYIFSESLPFRRFLNKTMRLAPIHRVSNSHSPATTFQPNLAGFFSLQREPSAGSASLQPSVRQNSSPASSLVPQSGRRWLSRYYFAFFKQSCGGIDGGVLPQSFPYLPFPFAASPTKTCVLRHESCVTMF